MPTQKQNSTRKAKDKFPIQLMTLLNGNGARCKKEYESVISWTPDGNAFTILQPEQFEDCVMPDYFISEANLASFCRKLYKWGFKKSNNSDTLFTTTYNHKYFKKSDPDLCHRITFSKIPKKAMLKLKSK